MHAQRVALVIAAAVGMVCTFLPWLNVPLIGAVYGTRGDGWITLALCAGALVCAFAVDLRTGLSLGPHITSALIGCVVFLIALWKIIDFHLTVSDNEFGALVSIGVGLYLLVGAGAAIALLPALVRGSPVPPPPVAWPPPWPGQYQPPQSQWQQPHPGSWPPPNI